MSDDPISRLGREICVRANLGGLIADEIVQSAKGDPDRAIDWALSLKLLPKEEICAIWGDIIDRAYVNPLTTPISISPNEALPRPVAEKARAICIYRIRNVVTVAMADPLNEQRLRSLSQILQREVSAVYSHPDDIKQAQRQYYGPGESLDKSLAEAIDAVTVETVERGGPPSDDEVLELSKGQTVTESFDWLLMLALNRGASDIHLEAGRLASAVRFRVDGNLLQIRRIPHTLYRAFIIRLKVLANMDVAEQRRPQDGRFSIRNGEIEQNFRVSVLPGIHGEKAVVRVLGSGGARSVIPLEELALPQTIHASILRIVASPNGLFIVTGPTGSGKTTTLYASLAHINDPALNISTIEDPVEYQLDGANHFQVNSGIGVTFASIMRALLRQDPDVILVGEIRDAETAKIAAEAALTGHIVFTTLHTNNALQAVTRLIEIGVESYLLAPSITGVLAQRLVRTNCSYCSESYRPSDAILAKHFDDFEQASARFARGVGCNVCHGTGFRGRIGIYEHLEVTEEVRTLISSEVSASALLPAARRAGYRSLRYDGLMKAALGATTLEEVERKTVPDFRSVSSG